MINFIGSFVIGCFGQYMELQPGISQFWVLFVQVGICGGFTTFSTFSLESYSLISNNQIGTAFLYMFLSLIICLFAVFAGIIVTKYLIK